jgi:serine/threonine-protein kinase HipA
VNELAVHVFGERCGVLTATTGLDYAFEYDPTWRPDALHGISMSLPRRDAPSTAQAVRAYFGGLLPEGAPRRRLAQERGFDELDDLAFLKEFGRDCPGAVQVLEYGTPPPVDGGIDWLDDVATTAFVEDLRVPNAPDQQADRYSISLAGAQLKRGIVIDGDRIGIPTGATRSTHIVKLAVPNMSGVVENEHAMLRLAAAVGVRASESAVLNVGGERLLLSTRYDRIDGDPLHQEDFCQALGRLSSHKYERFDSRSGTSVGPGIADMVGLVRDRIRPSVHQVDELLRAFWFNVLVGNVDAHAKNYSLLYRSELDAAELAPLYDSICIMAHHANEDDASRRANEPLIMNVGGQTRFWQLTRGDIDAHARSLRIPTRFLRTQVGRLAGRVADAIDGVIDELMIDLTTTHPVLEVVRAEVGRRCEFVRGLVTT